MNVPSSGVAGESPTPIAVVLPALITVTNAVAAFPTITDRLLGRTAAASACNVKISPSATSAWTSPKPESKSKPAGPMLMAVFSSAAAIVGAARAGCFCSINAATPAACGTAADVPGNLENPWTVVTTPSGATISGFRRITGVARRWPAVANRIRVPPADEYESSTGGVTPNPGVLWKSAAPTAIASAEFG